MTLAYGRHASGTEAEQTGGRHSPAIVAERYGRHAAYGSRGRWRVPVARRPFYVAHGGRHRFGFRSPLALVEADGSLTRIGYGPDYPPAERITERDMSEME